MADWWSKDSASQLLATSTPASTGSYMPPGFEAISQQPSGGFDLSFLGGLWNSFVSMNQDLGALIGQQFGESDEEKLASAIYQKMGPDVVSVGDRHGMDRNLAIARQAAHRAMNDPTYRQQLSQSLGWNQNNPEVQRWVAQGGNIPQTPTDQPVASGGAATGVTGTGKPPTDPSAASVQNPFPSQYFNDPNYQGNNYGDQKPAGVDWGGWQWHQGQDYGVPQGTPLSFPFAGKVVQTGYDAKGYGNYVTVEFGNGLRMTYAHLSYVQVKDGDAVTPGQQVGLSGGDGPGAGISTGAHLLVVLQDQKGSPIDPRPLLSAIYKGTTLGALQGLGVAETGTPTNAGSYTTPDGHVVYVGTADDQYYSLVSAAYEHYYGVKPPWSMVMAMRQQGITNSDQMAAIAANWPSDIPGVSFGQRENIYNTANGIAMSQYGRPIPDSLVRQFAQQGITSKDSIQLWFAGHLPSDMPKDDFQQLYDAANPAFQQAYGDGPSPEYVGYLWGQTAAPTGTASATPAGTPPLTTGGAG